MCVCMCECGQMHGCHPMLVEIRRQESVLSSHCRAPRGQTWVIRLVSRRIYLPSHLASPEKRFNCSYLLLRLDRTSPDYLFSPCLCSHCLLLLPCSVCHAFWFLHYQFKSHLLRGISSNTMSVGLGCFPLVHCHVFLAGTCYG